MRYIQKYPAPVGGEFKVPKGEVLFFAEQPPHGMQVWVEVAGNETGKQSLVVYPTGHDVMGFESHVASATAHPYIWHLYYLGED